MFYATTPGDCYIICSDTKEDNTSWLQFLRHVMQRGLSGTRLFVSDAYLDLIDAPGEVFPNVDWQRCVLGLLKKVSR